MYIIYIPFLSNIRQRDMDTLFNGGRYRQYTLLLRSLTLEHARSEVDRVVECCHGDVMVNAVVTGVVLLKMADQGTRRRHDPVLEVLLVISEVVLDVDVLLVWRAEVGWLRDVDAIGFLPEHNSIQPQMQIYTCVCVCVCAHTHARTHARTHAHTHTHTHTRTHASMPETKLGTGEFQNVKPGINICRGHVYSVDK